MSSYGCLTSNADRHLPTMRDIEESFDGNLCRCTGYRPILDNLLTITFTDHDQSANIQIFEKILTQDKTHRSLRIRASDFLGAEQVYRGNLDSHLSYTQLIIYNANYSDILNTIFDFKIYKLKRFKAD